MLFAPWKLKLYTPHSWDTLAWNKRIIDQIETTETQLEQDEQKFHKKLIDDQTQLEDKLDTLQVYECLR